MNYDNNDYDSLKSSIDNINDETTEIIIIPFASLC